LAAGTENRCCCFLQAAPEVNEPAHVYIKEQLYIYRILLNGNKKPIGWTGN
jgi:hypothetical protein